MEIEWSTGPVAFTHRLEPIHQRSSVQPRPGPINVPSVRVLHIGLPAEDLSINDPDILELCGRRVLQAASAPPASDPPQTSPTQGLANS